MWRRFVHTFAKGDVAALILEAVPGNMGCIPPQEGYLETLRALTKEAGTLLIVDEVMTGFRLAKGGACERFNIDADLVALGKIVGGGFPLAAFGGKAEIMGKLSPAGPVYQAGTLSGNPVAVAAGLATLGALGPDVYAALEAVGAEIENRVDQRGRGSGMLDDPTRIDVHHLFPLRGAAQFCRGHRVRHECVWALPQSGTQSWRVFPTKPV